MPKILIEKETSLNATDAYNKIKNLLSDDKDLRRLDSGYQCQFDDGAKTGSAKGKQFCANMRIHEGGSTRVELTIELPLLLTPFKGMVESTLKTKLDKILG